MVVFACVGIILSYGFGTHYRFLYNSGTSMVPTFYDNEFILMKKVSPDIKLSRLQIVAIRNEGTGDLLIKRVIGLPGERIELINGYIFINGVRHRDHCGVGRISFLQIDENNRIIDVQNISQGETLIPHDHIWIIGDARDGSLFGLYPIKNVRGIIVW